MKISILAMIICWLCLAAVCYAQIGSKTQGKIYGLWHNNDFGYQMTLMLNADGSGEFDGESIRFTAENNKLAITAEGITTTYTYSLQGNALTLSGGDLEQTIAFTRQGTLGTTPTQSVQPTTETKKATPATGAKNLHGVWSGYGETIEFKADGQCLYRGQPFAYTVSGNYITLETTQGNLMMAYSISGNNLNLTINNQNLTYTKGSGGTSTAGTKSSGKGGVDMSMVGKWCYMNVYSSSSGGSSTEECIVLKEDGTFEYYYESSRSVNTSTVTGGTASQNSDRGKWWVEGNRIHYNSQTQGAGSYALEKRNHPKTGDPMLVLDGKTYVTFYNKQPW